MAKSRQKLQIKNGALGADQGNIVSIKQGKCEKMLQIFHKYGVGALRSAVAGSGDSQFK